jgi:putative ABC transport system permease protein
MNHIYSHLKQAIALTFINTKSFPKRIVSSMVSMISIACVAAVILSVMAMTQGMMKTLENTGLNNTLLVMRAGAISELQSVMFPVEVNIMANHQQVLRDNNNQPIVSAEMFVNADYQQPLQSISNKNMNNKNMNNKDIKSTAKPESISLALRGISQMTYQFRPHFQLTRGELFKTGVRQLILGQALARKMPELVVGSSIKLGGATWLISGIFSDNNSVFESELWADIGMVQSDYKRGNTIQSIRLAIKNVANIDALEQEWREDPRLNVRLLTEKKFFAEQGQSLTRLIRWIGLPIAVIMALGAMVAALNTMYGAIANKRQEIATHKAIGFSPFAISFSILNEAIFIAFIGGSLGILPLYFIFDGWTASTQNASNLSQMMFNFDLTLGLMAQALLLSLLIGLIGGMLPAIKAMRLSVTEGLIV